MLVVGSIAELEQLTGAKVCGGPLYAARRASSCPRIRAVASRIRSGHTRHRPNNMRAGPSAAVAAFVRAPVVQVTDLHRHFIDHLTIPSRQGKGTLRRVPDVFDCWFESGSMPYAQVRAWRGGRCGEQVTTAPPSASGRVTFAGR